MHITFVVNHTINATPPERLQQHPLLFTTNHTDPTFFVWRLNSARPPHPGHITILLRSEIPSDMCAKLCTVAASNNRDHARNLSYYCLLATCIVVLFFMHIPFVVHHTINATPPERLQHLMCDDTFQMQFSLCLYHCTPHVHCQTFLKKILKNLRSKYCWSMPFY